MTLSEKLVVIRLSFIKYAFALLAEYHERSTAPNSAHLQALSKSKLKLAAIPNNLLYCFLEFNMLF